MKRISFVLFSLILFGVFSAFAQTRTIKGIVTSSEDNEPLFGVNVVFDHGEKTTGTRTGADGKFSIVVPSEVKTLRFSYSGMITQTLPITPEMKVVLDPNVQELDEVIVVAFGTQKKSAFTGSAVTVKSEDIAKRQVSNVTQALAGAAPGVNVGGGANQPGQQQSISIRGIGSFSASSGPLYVVDGVPYSGSLSFINTQDIESTTILKDASSAALYGARGANGVILITTKTGSRDKGRISVKVDARYGVNSRGIKDYDFMTDPGVYASKYFEGIYNRELIRSKNDADKALAAAYGIYHNTNPKVANLVYHPFTIPANENLFIQNGDRFALNPSATIGAMMNDGNGNDYWLQPDVWADYVFESNPRQEYNVTVSGASEKATYYFSAGYLNDQGYTVGSGFDRFTTNIRSDFRPKDWLKIGANIRYAQSDYKALSKTSEGGNSGNIFAMTNFMAPIYPLFVRGGDKQIIVDDFGNQLYDFGTSEYPGLNRPYLTIANPVAVNLLDNNNSKSDVIALKTNADFFIIEGLKASLNLGYDYVSSYTINKNNAFYGQFSKSGGIMGRSFGRTSSINLQQLLTYNKSIGKHNFDILAGHEFYYTKDESLYGSKKNLYNPYVLDISGAISDPNANSGTGEYATEGYLSRIQYDYFSKYFISASFRRDASSRFHRDNRWGNFWSLGTSWIISKEDFMSGLTNLDMLKVKVSYGMQGNDGIGSFRYMDTYSLSNVNGQFGVKFNSKGKESITWESSANLNAGIEFSLFKGRLAGGIDIYSREVTDMLFNRRVPFSLGYSSYMDNIGSMKNKGIDFELSAVIVKAKDFSWQVAVNAGHVKNILTKLPAEWEAAENGYRSGSAIYRVGGSLYDHATPHYLGVNDEGLPTWQTYDKETKEYGVTADYSVASEDHNRKIYTNLQPVVRGGLQSTVSYKGIDLSASCSYSLGGKTYDGTYASLMHGGRGEDAGKNWHKDILNSWTPNNTNTDIPMLNYGGRFANSFSDRFYISRNYLSINNLSLGYNIPTRLLKTINVNSLRVYCSADNLAVFSARQGFDPRFGGGVGYKAIRTVSGGATLTF